MKTVRAVYENGVFLPTEHVELPESCAVEFELRPIGEPQANSAVWDTVYEVLSERYTSGETDVSARHNKHQP